MEAPPKTLKPTDQMAFCHTSKQNMQIMEHYFNISGITKVQWNHSNGDERVSQKTNTLAPGITKLKKYVKGSRTRIAGFLHIYFGQLTLEDSLV